MNTLFDSHAHLNDRRLMADIEAVLSSAADRGVGRIICPGYDMESSRRAVDIARRFDNVWATVGVHPHDATSVTDAVLAELRELAGRPRVVAIGEIGLDYYRNISPQPVQQSAFRAQLALAKDLGMPVVIHNRDAGADTMRILEDGLPPAGGVLHCYSEDVDYALRSIAMGLYIGIAGPVTFGKNKELRDVARAIPEDRLLVETDAPYLTPEPYRGRRRNEPAYVRVVAEKVAEVGGVDLETVARITSENTVRLFKRVGE